MAVTSFDSSFSFKQDAVARLGDKALKRGKMSSQDAKEFANSSFMQMVEKVNVLTKQMSEARDQTRAETDPTFQPSDEDFKVEKAFKFDKSRNYYRTLGVTEYETQANIKKAYRELSLIYHPDKTAGLSSEEKEQYRAIFIELKNANMVLSDNIARRQYDAARDKEVASCEVRGTKHQERKDQFDPRNAEAVMAKGGPRCAQGAKNEGKVNASIRSKTVEVPLQVRLEKFVFGGMKTSTQTLMLKDEESEALGILEFDEQERDFEVEVQPGAPEPHAVEFREQGAQHEDAPPDHMRFVVSSKPHDVVERSDHDLRLKEDVRAEAGLYVEAEAPSVRGRHVLLWGLNPFPCEREGELRARLWGEGASREGALCLTLLVAGRGRGEEAAELAPALRRRAARQLQEKPLCEAHLVSMGPATTLLTEPECSIEAYTNCEQAAEGAFMGVKPATLFAISLSSKACSSGKKASEWESLKAQLLPLLRASGFALLQAAREVMPRPLAAEAAFGEGAPAAAEESSTGTSPDWKLQGNQAFARGNYWMAMAFYSKGLEELSEEQDAEQAATLLSNRAASLLRVQDYQQSLADAKRAAELRPKWTRAWVRVAEAACGIGSDDSLKEALAARCRVVELEPTGENLETLRALAAEQLGPSQAEASAAKDRGHMALRVREWRTAVAEYTVGIGRLDQQDRDHDKLRCALLSNRSAAFSHLQDWLMALMDAQQAVEAFPPSASARCHLGVAFLGLRCIEDAYAAFAEALRKDHKSLAAQKGREACLIEMAYGRTLQWQARKERRLVDQDRPAASTRVFAISDIHLDHSIRQWNWLQQIDGSKFQEDVLILAGNLAIKLPTLVAGLAALKSKFRRVFFTLGPDDFRVSSHEFPDSMTKLNAVLKACDELGVDVTAACVSEKLYVVPMLSWYQAEFDWTDPKPDPSLNVDTMCRWPMDVNDQLWKYLLKMNEQQAQEELFWYVENGSIISFSHFLPRQDLPFHVMTDLGMKAAKVQGCVGIEMQLRAIQSKLHVYGHSHFLHADEHDGVMYVQQPLGYPQERLMIHRDEERALLMQVYDGNELCMQPWDSVKDEAAEQEEMNFD